MPASTASSAASRPWLRGVPLVATLTDESLQPEWKAARELAKLEAKLYASGPKSVLVNRLERLAKKHAGTKCAERAAFLVEAAGVSPFK